MKQSPPGTFNLDAQIGELAFGIMRDSRAVDTSQRQAQALLRATSNS